MSAKDQQTPVKMARGRPELIPPIEERLGKTLLQHVFERMAAGASLQAIVDGLGISYFTLRRYLRRKGYIIESQSRLVKIRPPRPGRRAAAR